ncbi:hypothetical protein QP999_09465 [Corynebacterium sp. MSK004]|uniref:hypothetical protein n=1 Tax=unclassified Corynebacterium TaxID=2624378 RepID=UPI0008A5D93B|nr:MULTISPECIES: hypothetical protein [unclassified Corynebacterium]MDK8898162.1 hypothetical protein [Corynebacterium sp. MSK004]OFN17754.1 hypothetical protein HMPREF2604_07380 [Corynebacterium sp. HMSC055A01]
MSSRTLDLIFIDLALFITIVWAPVVAGVQAGRSFHWSIGTAVAVLLSTIAVALWYRFATSPASLPGQDWGCEE